MTAEPTVDRRGVASHWKTAGLLAGGLAVGYALVQERERVAGAVTNLQDTLTNDGLTLMHKLSEMADAFLAKVHETFVAAAPPTNLEAAVRHGLIGHPEEGAHHKPAAPNHSDLRFTMPWAEPIARLCEDLKVKNAATPAPAAQRSSNSFPDHSSPPLAHVHLSTGTLHQQLSHKRGI